MFATRFSTTLAAALLLGSAASAATITPVSVTADCAGGSTGLSGGSVTCGSAARSNLGSIEYSDDVAGLSGNGSFFSLGLNGTLVAKFDTAFTGTAMVVEVTNVGSPQREAAEVFGSNDGMAFTSLGFVTNQTAPGSMQNPGSLTFAGSYSFLGFRDVSASFFGRPNNSGDGYDIDSIAVSQVAPVPLPAAGLLLLGGLAGLGALRKRRAA